MQPGEWLRWLLEQHFSREPQYLLYSLLSIPLGLLVFLALAWGRRAHLRSMFDAVRFFFAPFAPRLFVVVMDVYGWRVGYDDQVRVEGVKGAYLLRLGPRIYRCPEDPLSYAEPVSLLDMKAPPGLPSPFGLVPRLVLAWIAALILSAYAFSQTAYLTLAAFRAPPTWVDVATTIVFAFSLTWYIRVVLDAVSATGLMLYAVEAPPSGPLIPIATRPEKLVEWVRLVSRSIECGCEKLEKMAERLGLDRASLETLLAKAVDAEHWQRRVAALEEQLDRHIEAAEAAALRGASRLVGRARSLDRLAVILVAVAAVLALLALLQPSIQPIHAVQQGVQTVTPAPPPPPPTATAAPPVHGAVHTATPAQPPPPP